MRSSDRSDDFGLSENDIQAYADGLISAERVAEIRRYLQGRPDEVRRVAFYGRLNAQIRHAFRETDAPFSQRSADKRRWRTAVARLIWVNPRVMALRGALALAAGLVAASGWLAALLPSDEALENAAIMALEASASTKHFAATLSTPTGNSGNAPDLSPARLRLTGVATMKLGAFSSATEYVYLNADGQPVVLLTAKELTMRTRPEWTARRVGPVRLLTWTEHTRRYVLGGDAETRGLMLAADVMSKGN